MLSVLAIGVATTGPGEWSVDEALGIADALDGVVGLLIAAGLGGLAGAGQIAAFYRPPAESKA